MEAIVVKMFILGKIKQFVIKEIYQKEIVMKGSKGIDKLDSVLDKFWDRAWEFIEKGRNSDNKYIPNFIEEPIQEGTEEIFKEIRAKFDLKALIEDIVAQGKIETGKM
jgi:hypothetical protein